MLRVWDVQSICDLMTAYLLKPRRSVLPPAPSSDVSMTRMAQPLLTASSRAVKNSVMSLWQASNQCRAGDRDGACWLRTVDTVGNVDRANGQYATHARLPLRRVPGDLGGLHLRPRSGVRHGEGVRAKKTQGSGW